MAADPRWGAMEEDRAEQMNGTGNRDEAAWLAALMEKDRLGHTSRLIRGLIHNINGPLHNLSMLGEMLTNGQEQLDTFFEEAWTRAGDDSAALRTKQRDRLQRLMQQIAVLSEMLQDFSIVHEMLIGTSDVDITFALDKLAKAFRSDLFFKHRVEVRLQLEENLPPVHIPGRALVPALMHLIRNALLALTGVEEKRITIESSREGPLIRISIRDTGIGFDPLRVEELCQLFYSGWPREVLESDDLESHFGFGLFAVRTLLKPYGVRLSLAREGAESVALLEISLPEQS
jgi:signal transduction histidine kinase